VQLLELVVPEVELPKNGGGPRIVHRPPLRELAVEQLNELFRNAALVRLQSKAAQFQARARQAGWEQALWEGLFRALGYKHNIWPMQRLAEFCRGMVRMTRCLKWAAAHTDAEVSVVLPESGLLPIWGAESPSPAASDNEDA